MTKQDKVNMINEALGRSNVAQARQAKAVILEDGRIEYQLLAGNGRYMMKATFREVFRLMHGEDMRAIKRLIG